VKIATQKKTGEMKEDLLKKMPLGGKKRVKKKQKPLGRTKSPGGKNCERQRESRNRFKRKPIMGGENAVLEKSHAAQNFSLDVYGVRCRGKHTRVATEINDIVILERG